MNDMKTDFCHHALLHEIIDAPLITLPKMTGKNFQKGAIKLTKRLLITYLISFIALSSVTGLFLFNPFGTKEADAAWFNDNWAYRKTLTFTHNATVSSATQVEFDIDTTAAPDSFQADCGDVRFTSPNGDILPYYYPGTDACDNASTDFDVLIPSIINGSNYIYMYYGNPAVSNGTRPADFAEATTTPSGGAATPGSEEKAPSPVAYWKFDDGQGTTVANSTTTASINGTTDGSWQTENQCVSGKCLLFNGTSQEVTAPNSTALNMTNYTLSTWVSFAGTPADDSMILERGQSITDKYNYYLLLDPNGSSDASGLSTIVFGFSNNADDAYTDHYYHFTPAINTWYNFVVTMDDTNNTIKLFINGNQVASESESLVPNTGGTQTIDIGRGDGYGYLKGFVDEYKVYSYVLSADQVKANFNARSNPEGVSAALGANTQNMPGALSNGLVGYWKMDQSSWNGTSNEAIDSSGNGNHGTAAGNATTAVGRFGNGGTFDGTGDYVSIADAASLDTGANSWTMSVWANPANSDQTSPLITKRENGGGFGQYSMYICSGSTCSGNGQNLTAIFQVNGTGNYRRVTSTTDIADGNWHMYTMVADKILDTIRIYRDGEPLTVTTTDTGSTWPSIDSTDPLRLANDNGSTYYTNKLDEARIYNRALSPAEVSQLYNWAPGPVGYWKMDEGSGTTITDSSGNANNSSAFTGNVAFNTGKYGKGLAFDGVNDVVRIPESTTTDLGKIGQSYTVMTWIKNSTTYGSDTTFFQKTSSGNPGPFQLFTNNFNTARFRFSTTNWSSAIDVDSGVDINDGKWHHITGVRNIATGIASIYVDGVFKASETDTITASDISSNDDISIGNGSTSYISNDFNGLIDDTKIYNYARTDGQIVEDMNAGHPAPGSPVGSAVGWWKFNEGADNTCSGGTNDVCNSGSAGNAIDGTLTATSRTLAGKFGGALDGATNRRAAIADSANLDFAAAEDFSLSLWFKSDSATNPTAEEYLVEKGGNVTTDAIGYAIYSSTSGGTVCFGIDDDALAFPEDSVCSTTDVYDATWHHLLAKKTGISRLDLSVDGRANGTADTAISATGTLENASSFYLGDTNATDGTDEFLGDLDEVKVFRSALTNSQVTLDMNQASTEVLGALSDNSSYQKQAANQEYCIPGDATACTAPVARYDFEKGTGTTVNDTSTNGNTGTLTNGPIWARGKIGKGINFDGSDDYVDAGSASSLDNISVKTLEAWIYPESLGESNIGKIFSKIGTGFWQVQMNGETAINFHHSFSGTDGSWQTSTGTVPLNTWSHIAITYDRTSTSNVPIIYINGVSQTVTVGTTPTGTADDDSAGSLLFGSKSDTTESFDGTIDQIRVFNYARSAAQVAWDYNKGGPVGYWKMDECQGTVANDASGNNNPGTISGGAGGTTAVGTCNTSSTMWGGSSGAGKINYALTSDGTDDSMIIPSTTGNGFINTGQYSAGMWIKPASISSSTNGTQLIRKSNTGNGFRFFINSASKLAIIYPSASTCASVNTCISTTTIPTATWTHVLFTFNNGTSTLYINGKRERQDVGITSITSNTSDTTEISTGTSDCSGFESCDFNGQMDDLRIYNYTLNETQIKTIISNGAVSYQPQSGAP